MDLYHALIQATRRLLAEALPRSESATLLERSLEVTRADRCALLARDGDAFVAMFEAHRRGSTGPARLPAARSTLVRRAIDGGEVIEMEWRNDDAQGSAASSGRAPEAAFVLVAPLNDEDDVHGALDVQRDARQGSFDAEAKDSLRELTRLASPFLRGYLTAKPLNGCERALERGASVKNEAQEIVASHPRMTRLLRDVAQVAPSPVNILLSGETGTGKELIARAIHENSPRRSGPFATVHTAALPGTLLESELFGHARGAFTGADRRRAGRIASTEGGTLLLDEVAEIPLEAQSKLLRFLQFREIQKVGSDHVERVDVRVVAATHRDLGAMVKAGAFRADLYFRLKVIELNVPPLRERASDIPMLVDHFLRLHWRRASAPPRFTPRAERAIQAYSYPGNVRELAHAIQRACVLATGPELDVDTLPPEMLGPQAVEPERATGAASYTHYVAAELNGARAAASAGAEQAFVEGLMKRFAGNISQAARHAGMHRSYLQRLLARMRQAGP